MRKEMEGIENTVRRILRITVAGAMDPRRPDRLTPDDVDALLEPIQPQIDCAMGMLKECLVQASVAGANSVHQALHKAPGVDSEMLDEAVEYADTEERDAD